MGNESDRRVHRPVGSYVELARAKAPAFLRPEVDYSVTKSSLGRPATKRTDGLRFAPPILRVFSWFQGVPKGHEKLLRAFPIYKSVSLLLVLKLFL